MTTTTKTPPPTVIIADRTSESINGVDTVPFRGPTDAELQDFLRDPIGYAEFDFSDPITLDEFSVSCHNHRPFIDVLT